MMTEFTDEACVACNRRSRPVTEDEIGILRKEIPDWIVGATHALLKRWWEFPDFKTAFDAASKIAEIAERERHHPEIEVGWGYLRVTLSTHAIKGLHRNDFLMAAKIDRALAS